MVNFYSPYIACSHQANVSLVAGEFSTSTEESLKTEKD